MHSDTDVHTTGMNSTKKKLADLVKDLLHKLAGGSKDETTRPRRTPIALPHNKKNISDVSALVCLHISSLYNEYC
jgi:hypothetical protein